MFTVQERFDPVGDAFEETGSVSLARKRVAEEIKRETNQMETYYTAYNTPTYYCKECGSPIELYKHKRKKVVYNFMNGEPIEFDELQRCTSNPCHQGHIWSKSNNKILDFIYKIFYMGISDLMECEICGKRKISVLEDNERKDK